MIVRIYEFLVRRPHLPDGRHELKAAYQIYEILEPFEETQQMRILEHLGGIFRDRAQALENHYGARHD